MLKVAGRWAYGHAQFGTSLSVNHTKKENGPPHSFYG